MKKAELFEKVDSGESGKKIVRCKACAQECVISPGKAGLCGVRKNLRGELYSLTYGRLVAQHIDPIEKKPLFDFMPGSIVYSIGTVGCNFACEWCQNFDISQIQEEAQIIGKEVKLNPLMVILAVVIGGLMWGIAGMVIFVPLFAMMKIISSHSAGLEPIGFLFGNAQKNSDKTDE